VHPVGADHRIRCCARAVGEGERDAARGLVEADLERAYRSRVDPRLNYEQALEMAMLIARRLRRPGSK